MAEAQVINVDLADVWAETSRKTLLRTLSWGDEVARHQTHEHVH